MIAEDNLQNALKALVPDYPDWYGWAKTDSDGNQIPNNERMQTKYVIVEESHVGKVKRPSDKQINDKVAELQADYDSKQYQRNRLQEYPSIQELVVALYDADDKAEIDKKRAEIKKKYPKPE